MPVGGPLGGALAPAAPSAAAAGLPSDRWIHPAGSTISSVRTSCFVR